MHPATEELPQELLHALRIKGLATTTVLADVLEQPPTEVAAALDTLAKSSLVTETTRAAGGWLLTPSGLAAYERRLNEHRTPDALVGVAAAYETFLDLNAPAKTLVSNWQQGTADPQAALEELEAITQDAAEALLFAARSTPRFRRYAERLEAAVERVRTGDSRYVSDPRLDSFHTVWFECHEDFLLTLGRSRAEEAS